MSADSPTNVIAIKATEHMDPGGSIVHSGLAFADAVLNKLGPGISIELDLRGLKGASSSYFNVFLRRIDEACGLAELDRHISPRFGSKVQEMVYRRSLEAVRRHATTVGEGG